MEFMEKGTRYRQLSYEERVRIGLLVEQGKSIRAIARILDRSPNTIAREVREKKVKETYQPKKAQHKTYWRRYTSKRGCLKVGVNSSLSRYVENRLKNGWSPERIAGRVRRNGISLSTKAVYKYVRSRCLERYLFWRKHARKGGLKRHILQHRDTSKRPLSVRPSLTGSGHLEVDFIVSRQSPAVLVVAVDRWTRRTMVYRLKHKTHRGVLSVLGKMRNVSAVKSITTDNDLVFRRWRDLEKAVSAPFFFTQPYHSWEKGLVENTNRWIRTFVPKKRDLATVSDEEIHSIETFLNETPRQCLGFKTATEVGLEEMGSNRCPS